MNEDPVGSVKSEFLEHPIAECTEMVNHKKSDYLGIIKISISISFIFIHLKLFPRKLICIASLGIIILRHYWCNMAEIRGFLGNKHGYKVATKAPNLYRRKYYNIQSVVSNKLTLKGLMIKSGKSINMHLQCAVIINI